jgi:PAS domain S-box-containing protein
VFLDSYNADARIIDHEFLTLKELVQDNPDQTIRAEDLIRSKDTWLQHSRTMISHRSQNLPVNSDWVRMGKAILDDISFRFDRFAEVEEGFRETSVQRVQHMKAALAWGGTALVILLSLTVAYVVRKQMLVLAASYREALATIEQRHAALVRSENDLEEQKEWLRVTLTSIGDGVIVTDAAGRVVLMNHESERLTGWTNSEALHQPLTSVFKMIDAKTRAASEDLVSRILKEKKTFSPGDQTLLVSRVGVECPIDDSAAPICDAKGRVLGVVVVFHDATQTRLAQQSLRAYSSELERQVADRTTTLQQAVSELEAFSYTVSHDLRSPLRAMQGFSEAVIEDYGDKLDEQGRNYLERIRKAGQRLDTLIQDLLAYTRISRQDIELAPVDLGKIINDVIERDPTLNAPVDAGDREPAGQRGEVCGAGNGADRADSRRGSRREVPGVDRGQRDRHRSEGPGADFRDVRSGQRLAGVSRDGSRAGDREEGGADDARGCRGRVGWEIGGAILGRVGEGLAKIQPAAVE